MKTLIKTGAKATGENWRDNWLTPEYLLDAVKAVFKRLPELPGSWLTDSDKDWLDPCPAIPSFDALTLKQEDIPHGKMFINPPFSQYKKFINHLLPLGGHQIWIMHHDHSTKRMQQLLNKGLMMCLLRERVRFINPLTGQPSPSTAVGKAQTLIYVGEYMDDAYRFRDCFKHLGKCLVLDT